MQYWRELLGREYEIDENGFRTGWERPINLDPGAKFWWEHNYFTGAIRVGVTKQS